MTGNTLTYVGRTDCWSAWRRGPQIGPRYDLFPVPEFAFNDQKVRQGQGCERGGDEVRLPESEVMDQPTERGRSGADARVECGEDRAKRRAPPGERHVSHDVRREGRVH